MTTVTDIHRRPFRNLRISVTDRCNLRCAYCMPEEDYVWLPREQLLTFEEVDLLVSAFCALGVERVRLTGGEPLLRRDLPKLVALLAGHPQLRDLALTTNGLLLGAQAADLRSAGLRRVTVSLDTLRADRYRELTRRDDLARCLAGIEAATAAGFERIKLNMVVLRGTNDDELFDLLELARAGGHELRFIEYMDVGGATRWSREAVLARDEILERVARRHGEVRPLREGGSAPADRYALEDGTVFGIVASTTAPFCGSCDRARLTADGHLYTCLYARRGLDLATPLRAGASVDDLEALIAAAWRERSDRGAEERLGMPARGAFAAPEELRRDPRLEMHTRGG